MPSLQILKGPVEGKLVPLGGDRFILGRNPDCSLSIPITSVSREHAQILRLEGRFYIEDKQSRNGTFVNNERITVRTLLKNNDTIRICDFLATFLDGSTQPPRQETEVGRPLFRALAEGSEENEGRIQYRESWGASVEEECQQLRDGLENNHIFLSRAENTSLTQRLKDADSSVLRLFGRGFHRVVVLDAAAGLGAAGKSFDLERFLRHAYERMVRTFNLRVSPENFHVENVSQILKDESRSLFCFLNVQLIPVAALRRLRGFTQEAHQVLFLCCGERDLAQEEADEDLTSVNSASSSLLDATVSSQQPAEKLRSLLEISANLNKTLQLDELLPRIADSLFGLFRQADRCFLIQTEDGHSTRLIPRVVKTRRPHEESTARFSGSIVRKCLESAQAFLSDDAPPDDHIQLSQSIADFKIRSVMCVPLCGTEGKAFGVVQLDTQDRSKKFTQDDLKLLWGVANQAAIAFENARRHEETIQQRERKRDLELAHRVQLRFLPKVLPELPGYQFAADYQPAQEVGGDYYGFVPLSGGRLAVAVGDVAGKGVAAALFMAKLSSDARFSLLADPEPARAVTRLNNLLAESATEEDRFVSLVLAMLDPAMHTATLISAGHDSPLLYRPGEPLREVLTRRQTGLLLGIDEEATFDAYPVPLEPGDVLLLFTDGLTNALDVKNQRFLRPGIEGAVRDAGRATPQALVDRIVKAVQQHAAGCLALDDLTLVCVGRRP